MEELIPIFVIPSILFLTVVAPIWIVNYYRHKQRTAGSLTATERDELDDLAAAAETMRERIEVLESILDAETPSWRQRAER